mgnify:CR=1 FL=1
MRTFSIDMIDDQNNISNMTLQAEDFHADPAFIVFTATAFSLMGLRQLYFLVDGLLDRPGADTVPTAVSWSV